MYVLSIGENHRGGGESQGPPPPLMYQTQITVLGVGATGVKKCVHHVINYFMHNLKEKI